MQKLVFRTPKSGAWLGLCAAIFCLPTDLFAQQRPQPRPELGQPSNLAPPSDVLPPAAPEAAPAQSASPKAPTAKNPNRGAVTNLPIPRYVTLKGAEGNARRGPGLTHRIDWVFTTSGTPLRVTAEFENWRRVEDFEGMGGWVHFTLLSGVRGIIVTQDMAEFHVLPDLASPLSFQAEAGALARIISCSKDWCRVRAGGERGWAPKAAFWGVDAEETIE